MSRLPHNMAVLPDAASIAVLLLVPGSPRRKPQRYASFAERTVPNNHGHICSPLFAACKCPETPVPWVS